MHHISTILHIQSIWFNWPTQTTQPTWPTRPTWSTRPTQSPCMINTSALAASFSTLYFENEASCFKTGHYISRFRNIMPKRRHYISRFFLTYSSFRNIMTTRSLYFENFMEVLMANVKYKYHLVVYRVIWSNLCTIFQQSRLYFEKFCYAT